MDTQKDFEVSSPPTDGISDLSFSSQAELLAATSWDNQVRVWEVLQNGQTNPKTMYAHEGPALTCQWSKDGTKLVSGGADKAALMMDITTGQTSQVAAHDAPIRCVRWVESGGSPILATGSWDKTVKYWDLRTPNPVGSVTLPERVYSMDTIFPLMVVGTADRQIHISNLNSPNQIFKSQQSPLKWQTRTIACFGANSGNGVGYAIGSIEGRCGIQYIDDKESTSNFSFKCHRESNNNIFAVNSIQFHPVHHTFCTAGSDGTFNFWDKDARQRLKIFPSVGGPIPATAFNRNGTILAYAVSYDWSKGHSGANGSIPNKIFLHAVKAEDIKPKEPKSKR